MMLAQLSQIYQRMQQDSFVHELNDFRLEGELVQKRRLELFLYSQKSAAYYYLIATDQTMAGSVKEMFFTAQFLFLYIKTNKERIKIANNGKIILQIVQKHMPQYREQIVLKLDKVDDEIVYAEERLQQINELFDNDLYNSASNQEELADTEIINIPWDIPSQPKQPQSSPSQDKFRQYLDRHKSIEISNDEESGSAKQVASIPSNSKYMNAKRVKRESPTMPGQLIRAQIQQIMKNEKTSSPNQIQKSLAMKGINRSLASIIRYMSEMRETKMIGRANSIKIDHGLMQIE